MQLDCLSTVNEACTDDFFTRTVIVIDVLRATSTIVTALEYGSTGVIPVASIDEARSIQRHDDLLGGERFCKKIIGFDFGNSSYEYMNPEIEGKRLIITTTNGTRALEKYKDAAHVIAGSMLNAAVCAQAALQFKKDILLVCAGTLDHFCLEDGLCAGLIINELLYRSSTSLELNDFAVSMHLAYKQAKDHLVETMLQCSNGLRLTRLGFREDVIYCSQIDQIQLVPILESGMMVPFPCYK
ncbi:MAG TPA: 2-phosphosulfolactate phosphatase [Bacilli bacterium]